MSLEIVDTHSGTLFDGEQPETVAILSGADMAAFSKRIVDRHPVYARGRKAVERWIDNDDSFRTGEAKIDFTAQSVAVVVGQYKITEVSGTTGEAVVSYEPDFDKHHDRAYTAAIISPAVTSIVFKCGDNDDGPAVRVPFRARQPTIQDPGFECSV